MEKDDIVPELIEEIQVKFQDLLNKDKNIQNLINLLKEGKATYTQANEYAISLGEIMSKTLGEVITSDKLPDETMYFNIANRVLNDALGTNHQHISQYCEGVQDRLNKSSGINLKPQIPPINQDRIDGLVNRISSEPFEKVKWLLDEPVVNFSQSVVDDAIRVNVDFHADVGFSLKIVRRSTGKCCDWCEQLAGVYDYKSEPEEVYHRHRYCRCTVDYIPDKNKRQNVHSKKWSEFNENDRIRLRKELKRKFKDPSRKTISKERFNNLTVFARKQGAKILQGGKWEKYLDSKGANAATIGDILIFRENPTISEVLEETFHLGQNLKNQHTGKDVKLAEILNEIEAKEYLIENREKYQIPRSEDDETRKHLKYYQEELKKWKKENNENE